MKTANEMGIDEVFDEIAGLLGWKRWSTAGWCRGDTIEGAMPPNFQSSHPVPRSLDTLGGIWPEGWCCSFTTSPPLYKTDRKGLFPECVAEAWKPNAFTQTGISQTADTELLARARLTLSVLRVSKS